MPFKRNERGYQGLFIAAVGRERMKCNETYLLVYGCVRLCGIRYRLHFLRVEMPIQRGERDVLLADPLGVISKPK